MALTQTEMIETYDAPSRPHLRLVEPLEELDYVEQTAEVPEVPLVILVAERAEDEWSRIRAERLIQRANNMLFSDVVEVELIAEDAPITLMEAIRAASKGDQEKRNMVAANARTEAIEITYKAGFVTTAELTVNEQGQVLQFGHTTEDVNLNALRFASNHDIIRPRSEAEARNSLRIEDAHRQGLLEDYHFVVFSRCADASDDQLKQLGFFKETKSMAVQATALGDNGNLVLESAFVAGVAHADAERHDQRALTLAGEQYGVDYSGLTDAEIIDRPILIHKSLMPNGVVDVVTVLDLAIESATGQAVFYGEAKLKQDYLEHRTQCSQREAELEDRVQTAVEKLLLEAQEITSPNQATERLNKVVEAEMLEEAALDASIDARVYGQAAAFHVEEARNRIAAGDFMGAQNSLTQAKQVARSSSCPSAMRESGTETSDSANENDPSQNDDAACKEVKNGDRVNCPFCKKKVSAIVPSKEEIFCSNGECTAAHPSVKKKK